MADQTTSSPIAEFETLWGGGQAQTKAAEGRESRQLKYWKRPSDGYIVTGPRSQTDIHDYQRFIERKHYTPLDDKFGYEMVGSLKDDSMTEGLTRLRKFQKNGGITAKDANGEWLMPGRQIVTLKWHHNAEVRAARPDVVENAVDLECKYGCLGEDGNRRLFGGWGKDSAQRALDQHISAAHSKAEAAEAIGYQNREALVEVAKMFGSGQANGMSQEQMIQMMAAAMVTAQKMMAEQGKIAQVVDELYPAEAVTTVTPAAETVFVPLGSREPNVSTGYTPTRQDIDSMSRPEAMSWLSQNKHLVPYPAKPLGMKTADYRKYITSFLYPEAA